MSGELGESRVGEGANHHGIEHARHDDGRIANGLAASQLGIAGREEDRLATKLDHPGLKRQAGTGGCLLEDHPQYTIFQRLEQNAALAQVLQLDAATNQAVELLGRAVHQGKKMPCAHINYLVLPQSKAEAFAGKKRPYDRGSHEKRRNGKGAILSRKSSQAQINLNIPVTEL